MGKYSQHNDLGEYCPRFGIKKNMNNNHKCKITASRVRANSRNHFQCILAPFSNPFRHNISCESSSSRHSHDISSLILDQNKVTS